MSADEFREIALSLPEAIEGAHVGHPDFRVRGKIFATLGFPDQTWGMAKLTPNQQQEMVARDPDIFQPVKGGWGRRGAESSHDCLAERGAKAITPAWAV